MNRKHKIHSCSINITRRKFNQLEAIKYVYSRNEKQYWLFKCVCGKDKVLRKDRVTSSVVKSCGCHSIDTKFKKTHGVPNQDRTYRSWCRMKNRCLNKNCEDYKYYGGRGIKVCKRWMKFENFLADMSERPKSLTLDRIDVNGNYEPSNCRWATNEMQASNTRRNVFINWNNKKQTIMQWSKELGIEYWEIRYFNQKGFSLAEIIKKSKTIQSPQLFKELNNG